MVIFLIASLLFYVRTQGHIMVYYEDLLNYHFYNYNIYFICFIELLQILIINC